LPVREVVAREVVVLSFVRARDFVAFRDLVTAPLLPRAPFSPCDVARLFVLREPDALLALAPVPLVRGDLEVVVRLAARFRLAVDACLGLAVAVLPISGKRPSRHTRPAAKDRWQWGISRRAEFSVV